MSRWPTPRRMKQVVLTFAIACGIVTARPSRAQTDFPHIPIWVAPGAYQHSGPDSLRDQARTITVRWMRDPLAEARPDFGGYRIYRVYNTPDTTTMELVRRFS